MAAPWYNVYVGAETGIFKGINVVKNYWDNLNSLQTAAKEKEICSMVWNDDTESEICTGLRNKQVLRYKTQDVSSAPEVFTLDGGKGNLRGLLVYGEKFITATDAGLVNVWEDEDSMLEIQAGENLHCIKQNPINPNSFGTGGKENDLKLWDINKPTAPSFSAKNVKDDWLCLRVPVWIMGISYLPDSRVVTCTGHHQVRMYDPGSQRRPVLDMQFDEYPLTAVSVSPTNDKQVVVGNTQGKMALLDLRQGKMVQIYKGFSGGIRSIVCHNSKPVVASCGLDRFLRIHDFNSRELLHKVYLKSRLNCVLLSKRWDREEEDDSTGEGEESRDNLDIESDGEKNEDDLWAAMDVVKTKTVSKLEERTNDSETKKRKREMVPSLKTKKKKSKKAKTLKS